MNHSDVVKARSEIVAFLDSREQKIARDKIKVGKIVRRFIWKHEKWFVLQFPWGVFANNQFGQFFRIDENKPNFLEQVEEIRAKEKELLRMEQFLTVGSSNWQGC